MSTFGEGVEVYGKLAKVIQRFRCDRPDEWTMDEFIREAQKLQKENDELMVRIAELENAVNRAIDANDMDDEEEKHSLIAKVNDTLLKKPEQSLAKIKADAIREMLDEVWRSDTERVDIEDYATNLEQDNERD